MSTWDDEEALAEAVERSLGEKLLASCDFSPGPSWGFNGIQRLVLTTESLHVFQRGVALTARRELSQTARTTYPLTAIRSVATKSRRALLGRGEALTLRLGTEHGQKTFTTKYADQGSRFETALRRQLRDENQA
jgi:hypothetical protein